MPQEIRCRTYSPHQFPHTAFRRCFFILRVRGSGPGRTRFKYCIGARAGDVFFYVRYYLAYLFTCHFYQL